MMNTQLQQAFDASNLLLEVASCAASAGLFCVVWGLVDVFSFFLNPVQWIASAFAGTPSNEKTEETGIRLARFTSDPWLQGLGLSIYQVAKYYNVILSSKTDNARWFAPMIESAIKHLHLTGQGETVLDRYIYLGQPLPGGFPRGYQTQPSDPVPPTIPCAPGYKRNPKTEVCDAQPNLGCLEGQHRAGIDCRPCAYDPTVNPCPPPVCAPGKQLVNGICIPECPGGQHLEAGQCVPNPPIPPTTTNCCN